MKKHDLSKWTNLENTKGLLFFAQVLEESLFDYTIDSYKARALNTHVLCLELYSISTHIKGTKIPLSSLSFVIEELHDAVKNDPAFDSITKQSLLTYVGNIENIKDNIDEVVVLADAILSEVQNVYFDKLITKLAELISDSNNKNDIVKLASSIIAELELRGFSRQFIYLSVMNFFFNKNKKPKSINNNVQLKDFLNIFKIEKVEYNVVVRCTRQFANYSEQAELFDIKITNDAPDILNLSWYQSNFLGKSKSFPSYALVSLKRNTDSYSAGKSALKRIELLASVCRFCDHRADLNWLPTVLVNNVNYSNNTLLTVSNKSIFKSNYKDNYNNNSNDILNSFTSIIAANKFSDKAMHVLLNALEYHRAAIEAKTEENQLLDLWAAIEGFLPPPRFKERRIDHYIETILPPMTLTYTHKIFKYLSDSLYHGGNGLREFIDSVEIEGDFFTKTVYLLTCKEMSDKAKIMCEKLDDYPLLRFRCYQCHDKFNTSHHIYNTLNRHKIKLKWHLNRIYNSRNQIIHSAKSLPYLGKLIENVHFYLDTIIYSMCDIADHYGSDIEIETAVKILSNHELSYVNSLKISDVECNASNFKQLIFGNANPLSPYVNK